MKSETQTVIIMIIAEKLLVELEAVTPNARLVEDLGADSLNVLEIVLDINEAFEIELSTDGLARVRKVEDLHQLVHQATAPT
ncbi:acyl carrier protein [Pseudomonas brassicacearum]|nr:acyl carrier protein [Pseudomonas brassicacearum]